MKITILLIALFVSMNLPSRAQTKFPDKFRIGCTGKQIKQLSIVIYSNKSAGEFTFRDRQGHRYEGAVSVLYPDGKSRAGLTFKSAAGAAKESEPLGILRYDNDGMILSDAKNHDGVVRWKLDSAGAKFLDTYDPVFDRSIAGVPGSGVKDGRQYNEFAVTCKAK